MDDLAIVVCTINRGKYLDLLLDNIQKQIWDKVTVVVVDDGSTDNTKSIVDKYSPHMKISYIYNDKKEYSSPAKARNIGWKSIKSKYISFTDPEIVIPIDTIKKCYDYHLKNLSVTALKPIMVDEFDTEIVFKNGYEFLFNKDIEDFDSMENQQIQSRKTWKDNHFSMMPYQALVDVDGVNENFNCWGFEGIDLIERIIDKGYRLQNFKNDFVYHLWHPVNRDMKLADEQRKKYGIKNCGLKDV